MVAGPLPSASTAAVATNTAQVASLSAGLSRLNVSEPRKENIPKIEIGVHGLSLAEICRRCDPSKVKELHIRGRQLTAEDNEALAQLSNLQDLCIEEVREGIETGMFLSLASMKSLKALSVSGSKMNEALLEELVGVVRENNLQLKSLDVSDCTLNHERCEQLAQIASLETLNVRLNRIGYAGLEALSQLPYLTALDVCNCGINQMPPVERLKNLKVLDIGVNGISDVGFLLRMRNLQRLYLSDLHLGDKVFELLRQLSLKSLNLENNGVTDAGVRLMAQMPTLESVHIGRNCAITARGYDELVDACVSEKARLRYVSLNESGPQDKLSKASVMKLAKSTTLLGLGLSNIRVLQDPEVRDAFLKNESLIQLEGYANDSGVNAQIGRHRQALPQWEKVAALVMFQRMSNRFADGILPLLKENGVTIKSFLG